MLSFIHLEHTTSRSRHLKAHAKQESRRATFTRRDGIIECSRRCYIAPDGTFYVEQYRSIDRHHKDTLEYQNTIYDTPKMIVCMMFATQSILIGYFKHPQWRILQIKSNGTRRDFEVPFDLRMDNVSVHNDCLTTQRGECVDLTTMKVGQVSELMPMRKRNYMKRASEMGIRVWSDDERTSTVLTYHTNSCGSSFFSRDGDGLIVYSCLDGMNCYNVDTQETLFVWRPWVWQENMAPSCITPRMLEDADHWRRNTHLVPTMYPIAAPFWYQGRFWIPFESSFIRGVQMMQYTPPHLTQTTVMDAVGSVFFLDIVTMVMSYVEPVDIKWCLPGTQDFRCVVRLPWMWMFHGSSERRPSAWYADEYYKPVYSRKAVLQVDVQTGQIANHTEMNYEYTRDPLFALFALNGEPVFYK